MAAPRLAFIGFGEAGPLVAKGVMGEGIRQVAAYDILVDDAATRDAWMDKARRFGAVPCASNAEAVAEADIVISTVTSKQALAAAEATAPHLRQGQLYLDFNSCSPGKKVKAAAAVEGKSAARYVDVAVMDTVPGRGHKVPMLLAGAGAAAAVEALKPYGMVLEVVGEEIGQASVIKMTRSIFMKGLESILCESMVAAHRAGVHQRVLDSIQKTFPGLDWRQVATYHMGRVAQHARRRADEMESVADTVGELGLEPFMSAGAACRLDWASRIGLKDRFSAAMPETLEEFLEAVDELDGKAQGRS